MIAFRPSSSLEGGDHFAAFRLDSRGVHPHEFTRHRDALSAADSADGSVRRGGSNHAWWNLRTAWRACASYGSDTEEIEANLVHRAYLSRKDLEICAEVDLTDLSGHAA